MRNWDCLLFVQRLDLVSQTCAGGLIFTDILGENKMAVMIINPTKMFNFLMNYRSNSAFLIEFMGFVYSKFNPQCIHLIEKKLEFLDRRPHATIDDTKGSKDDSQVYMKVSTAVYEYLRANLIVEMKEKHGIIIKPDRIDCFFVFWG